MNLQDDFDPWAANDLAILFRSLYPLRCVYCRRYVGQGYSILSHNTYMWPKRNYNNACVLRHRNYAHLSFICKLSVYK